MPHKTRNPWFLVPQAHLEPRIRLICLPHAGAGASAYFSWGALLRPSGIEVAAVQYPGHESRISETPIADAAAVTAALADAWTELSADRPCAVFGHSMGALLAFELAAELSRRGARNPPRRLFLSGHNPPHAARRMPPIGGLPDDRFLSEIASRYGSLPESVLAHPEMMALLLPVLRADFRLLENYRPRSAAPVEVPFSVLGAVLDPWTSEPELSEWRRYSVGEFRLRMFAGGHFFPQKSRDEVLAAIRADLS
jgi:medium-chain acyl-[acyl-carrier-protein] hydrolase